MGFNGKTAIITGAGGGMGLQIATDLIHSGVNVALLDIKPEPAALKNITGTYSYYQVDISEEQAVADVFKSMYAATKRCDYLINVAGVLWFDRDKSVVDIDLSVWDQVLAINLKSMAHTTRYAIPLMKKTGGGAMVHFSSIQFLRGDPVPQDAYSVSKAGVVALSRSLAAQFAVDNIRSNTILPGATLTPLQERWQGDTDIQKEVAGSVPLKRLGTVQDMSNACLFLLSDEASYITGVDLCVDGGVAASF